MKKPVKMTRTLAKKILGLVDKGLCSGMGKPEPGQMCVEAAVCYAMGLPHGDEPPCVSPAVRKFKISLNDASWSSNEARAKGMRRLAIAQLGTADTIDDVKFAEKVARICIKNVVPRALRSAASMHPDKIHKDALEAAAIKCEKHPDKDSANAADNSARAAANAADNAARAAANAAYAAANAAYDAANAATNAAYDAANAATNAAYAANAADNADNDAELALFAEEVVQVLIEMKAQGTQWLDLTEAV